MEGSGQQPIILEMQLLKQWLRTRDRKMKKRSGQSVLEYAILLSALCAVLITMFTYMHHAVNAKLLSVQDRVNEAVQ